VFNYLNLGFLYRDAAHDALPMIGCYWKLNLKGSTVSVSFMNLGNRLKEFRCPDPKDFECFPDEALTELERSYVRRKRLNRTTLQDLEKMKRENGQRK
jgi:hypothetical protein